MIKNQYSDREMGLNPCSAAPVYFLTLLMVTPPSDFVVVIVVVVRRRAPESTAARASVIKAMQSTIWETKWQRKKKNEIKLKRQRKGKRSSKLCVLLISTMAGRELRLFYTMCAKSNVVRVSATKCGHAVRSSVRARFHCSP